MIPSIFEPVHEKTNNLGFRSGLTQTGLYSHSLKFRIKEEEKCTIRVAKTKALISFAVTAKLASVFAHVDCWFCHEATHFAKFLLNSNKHEIDPTHMHVL